MSAQSMPTQVASVQPASLPSAAPKLSVVPEKTYTHTIESGESLHSIARKFDVSTDQIVLANGLSSPDKITVGQTITIPGRADMLAKKNQAAMTTAAIPEIRQPKIGGASILKSEPKLPRPAPNRVAKIQEIKPVETVADAPKVATNTPKIAPKASDKFRWPASGKLIADFAASKGTGINIQVPEGTAIRAAGSGSVIYVGNAVEGYGNLILIKHDNGYVSAYAHLSQISVSKGDEVTRGDAIGQAGMTGSVTSAQLHFELRKGATPVDPEHLLAG